MNGSGKALLKMLLLSMLVAGLLLVTVVLPAEYDVDPLGTGSLLGLTGLSRTGPAALTEQAIPLRQDRVAFELSPFESVEYKYRLEAGAAMNFTWRATGEVVFDFHAEPVGAGEGYAESFEQGRGSADKGTYVAPFPGIHGWFWENRGTGTVTVMLDTAGFYETATEFRDNDRGERLPPLIGELD